MNDPTQHTLLFAVITAHCMRSVENTINVIILWLVLEVNSDKYVCLCKCCHSCILKNCMKEDPNMIGEGFENEPEPLEKKLFDINGQGGDRIEGHDLFVTDNDEKSQVSAIPSMGSSNNYVYKNCKLLNPPTHWFASVC